jgi:hypothetical protein
MGRTGEIRILDKENGRVLISNQRSLWMLT